MPDHFDYPLGFSDNIGIEVESSPPLQLLDALSDFVLRLLPEAWQADKAILHAGVFQLSHRRDPQLPPHRRNLLGTHAWNSGHLQESRRNDLLELLVVG